ncbi:MAG: c-type cytochrome [Planctomycetaceae bacterium]|nr:c-type cytochrome [Planctomycetaceae bacterium]
MRAIVSLLLLIGFGLPGASAQEPSLTEQLKAESLAKLAQDVRTQGNAVRGAILFPQQKLGCANCHAVGNDSLLGPDLTRGDEKLTDEQFVEAMLFPSKRIRKGHETTIVIKKDGKQFTGRIIRQTPETLTLRDSTPERRLHTFSKQELEQVAASKVSSMPEKLANQLQNRQDFLDLVRYVMEISSTGSRPANQIAGGQEISPDLKGLVLIKDLNCAACHQDDVADVPLTVKKAPDLTNVAQRIDPNYIERFIADPSHVKPGTTMPAVLSSMSGEERGKIATVITHYFASQTKTGFSRQQIDPEKAAEGRELFHTVGCVACHSPRDDEGVELLIESSVPLGPLGDKYNLDGLTEFLKEPHQIRPSGRMPNLKLTHFEAQDLAHYLTQFRKESTNADAFLLIPTLAAKGRQAFHEQQCVQCHTVPGQSHNWSSKPLSKVRPERGCLSGQSGNWPVFNLSKTDRENIQAALARDRDSLSPEDRLNISLTAMRCLNCHQRGELGGVTEDRNNYFHTTNPNLGPQGRIPPTLTNVGAKLKPKWMRQVLVSGRAIRPYLLTRMPQYGPSNVEHVIDLFQDLDELPDVTFAEFEDEKEIKKTGAEMVGTGGLNCIACHTFQLKQAATMPAVDLTEMAERLQKRWFYQYMKNPQQLSANTVMPSFWPGGQAIRKDILNGDPDLQIEALWQYLLDGRQARTPRGLIVEPIELLATEEAVMLRRKYPEVGKRGIGVGYPAQVNIVFDAEQMRLATLWRGRFADPGGVWRSQGHGVVRPLERNVMQFAKGPDLDDAKSPWIVDDGRPPAHHFRGYRLDEKRRPTFMYEYGPISVEDYFLDSDASSSESRSLLRTLQFVTEEPVAGLRLRLASGKQIEPLDKTRFSIDGQLQVIADGKLEILTTEAGRELLLLFDLPAGETSLTVEYLWPEK